MNNSKQEASLEPRLNTQPAKDHTKNLHARQTAAGLAFVAMALGGNFNAQAQGKVSPPGVVKSVNGFAGQVTLSAGPGIALTPAGNGLQIGAH